jgi:hypothetical protein
LAFRLDLAAQRAYLIRRAADGDKYALDHLLHSFIQGAKQGETPDPEGARVVADVLERVLAGEDIGVILGTKVQRGRPHKLREAILVHAMVRHLMQLPRRRWRRGDAKVEVAEILGLPIDTVQNKYKRVQGLIKEFKDRPKDDLFFLERRGFSSLEQWYLMDQSNAVFLLDFFGGPLPLLSAFYVDGRTEALTRLFRRRMARLG